MSLSLSVDEASIVIDDPSNTLAGKHHSQLSFWGFHYDPSACRFRCVPLQIDLILGKVSSYFDRNGIRYILSAAAQEALSRSVALREELTSALESGKVLKDGGVNVAVAQEFIEFSTLSLARSLKEHQLKAALHLLAVKNGANFSVPGSGKTAVVLSVFHKLREAEEVDALFVVGPPSCFGPWKTEYKYVIGCEPTYEILAGGDVDERRSKYFASKDALCDLYLTSFQTLHRDWDKVQILLKQRGVRFYFVVDEAHYIKQIEGAWASAVQMVACHANYRCVLTGTPFPKSLSDAFNLFDVLWPNSSPISQDDRTRIEYLTQKNMNDEARNILDSAIGPLFYRVRKSELGLAPQTHAVLVLPMNRYERLVYDSVLDRIRVLSESDYAQNLELILRLRRGRMIRLRQCLSLTKLLGSAILEYNENLLQGSMSLADIIKHYEDLETPRKLEQLLLMVKRFMQEGENSCHLVEFH